jgi:hypothetical protein
MGGIHRADQISKTRVAVAGALTAGALLLAPVGAAIVVAPGVATAAPAEPVTTKKVYKIPGLKIEIKRTTGEKPKIKVVPLPNFHLPQRPTPTG